MSDSTTHACISCGNNFTGKYCNSCGEKVYVAADRKVVHLAEEVLHFITHFDGTLFTTVKAIFTKPGQYAFEYCLGKRKRYFKPVSFFLLLVILYLIFPAFEALNMRLFYNENHRVYGSYAKNIIDSIIAKKNITHDELEMIYHQKGEKTSKILLFLILPFMAFISWLMAFKKRRYYFDHFIFSVEIVSVFILWGFLLLPLINLLFHLITGLNISPNEGIIGIYILTVFMIYLGIASRRFFGFKWWYSFLYTLIFTIALLGFIEYIYKFILFVIAIHLV